MSPFHESKAPKRILFTSLGTTVLDEIYVGDKLIAQNSPGGAAIFSALCARLFAPPSPNGSSPIALKINAGEDFPIEVENTLRSWKLTLDLQRLPNTSSTRAELRYTDASLSSRNFRYLTPILRPHPADLVTSPLLASKAIHLLTTPQDLPNEVTQLLSLPKPLNIYRPFII